MFHSWLQNHTALCNFTANCSFPSYQLVLLFPITNVPRLATRTETFFLFLLPKTSSFQTIKIICTLFRRWREEFWDDSQTSFWVGSRKIELVLRVGQNFINQLYGPIAKLSIFFVKLVKWFLHQADIRIQIIISLYTNFLFNPFYSSRIFEQVGKIKHGTWVLTNPTLYKMFGNLIRKLKTGANSHVFKDFRTFRSFLLGFVGTSLICEFLFIFVSSLRKLCYREKFFFWNISVRVFRIV